MNQILTIQCRKCRTILYENQFALDAHGSQISKLNDVNAETCKTKKDRFCFGEDDLPEWMLSTIELHNWTKGKLNCPKCDIKIGSFDFVSGNKCDCSNYVIPPVYLIKSKTDVFWS